MVSYVSCPNGHTTQTNHAHCRVCDWDAEDNTGDLSGLEVRLLEEPDYKPHCIHCSTMRRMTLWQSQGRRFFTCETVRDDTFDGTPMAKTRVGCGYTFDIHTGQKIG